MHPAQSNLPKHKVHKLYSGPVVKKLQKHGCKIGSIACRWSKRSTKIYLPIQFGIWKSLFFLSQINPPFPLLALWGNKNGPPSMKLIKLNIFWNKMGSMGCKWSSLNATGTETPLSHSLLGLEEFPFPHY